MSKIARLTIPALALALAAGAADAKLYPGARSVSVEDFTGVIEITVGGDALSAELADGTAKHPVSIGVENGVLRIAGEPRPKNFQLHDDPLWRRNVDDPFETYLRAYPRLKISAPAGADFAFEEVISIIRAGDLKSHVSLDGRHLDAMFGNLESADVAINGAGDVSMGDIDGALSVAIGGSGDFDALSAGSAAVAIGGSGDVLIGPIAGDATLKIAGSGDIETSDIGGALTASIHGSGDINVGATARGAELSIAGSGDIVLASINGAGRASIAGNGDIAIDGGRAENLKISVAGSGGFDFAGVSTNLQVSMVGSGLVSVADNEGSLDISGDGGEVVIGGRRIERKRR